MLLHIMIVVAYINSVLIVINGKKMYTGRIYDHKQSPPKIYCENHLHVL